MKKITNRLWALMLMGAMGSMLLMPTADARLIFTTEDEAGVDAASYILNQDADSTTEDVELFFGNDDVASLLWDAGAATFIIDQPLSFVVDNKASAPGTCTTGQMYYNTGNSTLYYCSATNTWTDLAAGSISAGSIGTTELAADAVTAEKLAADTAGAGLVQNGTSGALDVGAGTGITVNADDIAITTGGVTATQLATDAVTTIKITDANVTADKLATDAVTTTKIADGNVTNAKLATDAVTTIKITDANVTADKLATDAVTTIKIADANVTADKLATNAVTTVKIADDNVTAAKLAADTAGLALSQNGTSGALDVNVDGSTLEINGLDQLAIKAGGLSFTDFGDRTVAVTIMPEFQNYTLSAGTSGANVGTMYADYDSTENQNYYKWSSKRTTLQDYSIVLQWALPDNFQEFANATNPIEVDYKTTTDDNTENKLDITLYDTVGDAVALGTTGTGLASSTGDAWVNGHDLAFATTAFDDTDAGKYMTMVIKMSSKSENAAQIGAIKFNMTVK